MTGKVLSAQTWKSVEIINLTWLHLQYNASTPLVWEASNQNDKPAALSLCPH